MNIIIPKIPEKTIELPTKKEIIKGIVVVLLSQACLGSASPLGLSFAAVMGTSFPYIPMIALMLGAILSPTFSLKYICAYFLFRILVHLRNKENDSIKAVALGFSLLFTGAVELLILRGATADVVSLCIESVIVGLCYILFTHVEDKSDMGAGALLLITGAVFNGLSGVVLPHVNINIGCFCSFFASICLCYCFNLPVAVFGSCFLGFLVNINTGNAVEAAGLYALASIMGALLSDMGKLGVCAGFLCGATVSFLEKGSFMHTGILDLGMALAMFAVLPEVVHYRIFETLSRVTETDAEAEPDDRSVSLRLNNIASAVSNLADGICEIPERKKDRNSLIPVFDMVASRVCRGCSLEANCWKKDRTKTYANMYELWDVIETEGYCSRSNIPIAFTQVCMRSESLMREFSHAYELYKQSCMHHGESVTERGIVARQYGEISKAIKILSHEVETGSSADEAVASRYVPVVTSRQEAKKGQAVCGDSLVHFEKNGRYFVILCDGMGYGEVADTESRLTSRLFFELLNAGFQAETAVNMINSVLALKSDKESFSSVDLLEIDLCSGNAKFLKVGSAQSFVKTRDGIEELCSKALPVGILDRIEVKAEEIKLRSGDSVLMVSDGIGEAGDGVMKSEWIKKLFRLEKRSDENILQLIFDGAKSRSRTGDDMTGIIIRLKKAKGDAL